MTTSSASTGPVLSRRTFASGVLLAAAGLAVGGCGGGSSGSSGSGGSGGSGGSSELRIGYFLPPVTLDPGKGEGVSMPYINPAYDPLIYRAPDGSYEPRLAASWTYLGRGNQAFELTMNENATFSDGTPVTAKAIKANLDYFREAKGQAAAFLAPISEVKVADELTLRLTLSSPHPHLPTLFTQDFFAGNMISPAGIAEPERLATESAGAGPYMLAPDETVAGDHYTYQPNPEYWNAETVRYDRVTIKVLSNENTALAALETGQVDVIGGSHAIADGAQSAGMEMAASPNIVFGIQLNDRDGKLSPALGDVRVRQALNFAINRKKITEALLGEHGIPTEQAAAPEGDGWSDTDYYRYDPAHAGQLLTEGGYPDGFNLPVLIPTTPVLAQDIVQAIGADLEQIGVTLEITAREPAAMLRDLEQFPASSMTWGVLPPYFMGRGLWLGEAIGMNPFHSSDPDLEDLDQQAAAAEEDPRTELDRQIIRRVVELGWFLPVCLTPQFLFYDGEVVEIGHVPGNLLPTMPSWRPVT